MFLVSNYTSFTLVYDYTMFIRHLQTLSYSDPLPTCPKRQPRSQEVFNGNVQRLKCAGHAHFDCVHAYVYVCPLCQHKYLTVECRRSRACHEHTSSCTSANKVRAPLATASSHSGHGPCVVVSSSSRCPVCAQIWDGISLVRTTGHTHRHSLTLLFSLPLFATASTQAFLLDLIHSSRVWPGCYSYFIYLMHIDTATNYK